MENSELKRILETFKVVAVVGLSRQPNKDSNIVAKYLKEQGYRIIPVNPSANEILGEKAYADLLSIPEELQKTVEVVCVFRPSDKVMPIVEQAVQMRERFGKPHVVWMQRGIINHEAAKKAEAAGIKVIMDRCMMVEHEKLIGEKDEELERIKQKKLRE
ncbi:MAG TPA: CoA-binding protein, partial [Candidatus Bathyarchaeota archaeon]|nr:CoA-binding protein [Candidatus Bathyarchaeota archaeon]